MKLRLDVLLLRGLITASEKDDQNSCAFRVVHPIHRPEIDLQFAHPISQDSMQPRTSMNQPIHADLNSSATAAVFK